MSPVTTKPPRVKDNHPFRLLVEGIDDLYTVCGLLTRHGIECSALNKRFPFILDCQGIENLLDYIPRNVENHSRLGIIVDADLECTDRWLSICNALKRKNIVVPDKIRPDGIIFEGSEEGNKIGVWIMPNNASPGKLEDFLSTLIADTDLKRYAWSTSEEAKSNKGAVFTSPDLIKAQVHTWLAWQEQPGRPFGTALNAHFFEHDAEVAQQFVAWFKRLFLTE